MANSLSWTGESALQSALARSAAIDPQSLEVDTVALYGGDLQSNLRRAGTAVLDLGTGGLIGLLEVRGRKVTILMPDLSVRRIAFDELVDTVLESQAGPMAAEVDALLDACGSRSSGRRRARRAVLCERLHRKSLGRLRMLSRNPGASFPHQLREAGLGRTLASFAVAHGVESMVWLAVWPRGKPRCRAGWIRAGCWAAC